MLKEIYTHLKNTQCFIKYREKVSEYNADALGVFLVSGLIVSVLAVILGLVLLHTGSFWAAVVLAVYFAVCLFFYRKYIYETVDHSTVMLYLAQIPVLIVLIFSALVLQPQGRTFFFMLGLLSFPVFILDRPRNILLYILLISGSFLIAAFCTRSGELLYHDILHCILTTAFSVCTAVFVLNDRIENVEKSQAFLKDSEHDPLTGIYNRRGGEEKIREYVEEGIAGTLIILDVDDFKHVNDTYGHAMGDEVLSSVSMTLSSSFRSSDIVMRMGGDEFIVYAPGLVNYFFLDGKLQQIGARMREITCAAGKDNITVSMGAVINDGSYPDYEALFSEADRLLYETKMSGKNSFRMNERPYSKVKDAAAAEDTMMIRAQREAASEAEEAKYKK